MVRGYNQANPNETRMAPRKKQKHSDASPGKSLGEELIVLERSLRAVSKAYQARLATDLALIKTWNETVAKATRPERDEVRSQGDMIGLLRKLKLKPEKGRRRDLRKIDSVLEELLFLSRQKHVR
jgi:hypothetical protein